MRFETFPLWVNAALFTVAASCVWVAGTRLAGHVDIIARHTGASDAFLGMLLLGVATSLPEVATTISGALIGNPQLVSGNLFGGVALQIAVLAVVDALAVRGALTYIAAAPILLFQGTMLLLLLAIALAGVAAGEPVSAAGIGLTPVLLLAGYGITLRVTQQGRYVPRWRPVDRRDDDRDRTTSGDVDAGAPGTRLYALVGVSGLVILGAGWMVAVTGDALADQTRLGSSFVGVALVAASTSLPELSTTLGAVRRRNHEMAIANILGTNCLELALFFVADVVFRGGPILAVPDASALFAGTVAMVVTCVFLLGMLERRSRTIFGMGVDSLTVLVVYCAGLIGLYAMR